MLSIARGLALVISGLTPIYFNDTPEFNEAAMGSLIGGIVPGLDIPNIVLVLFVAAIIATLLLSRTVLGRYTFALGSNEEAARLSGVGVGKWKATVYIVCGLFAGLGGVMIGARLNSAQPSLGFGYELDAIAAAVIGGVSLSGGEGTILGHRHRRLHHQHPHQRPAHHVRPPGVADHRHGLHRHHRRLSRRRPPPSAHLMAAFMFVPPVGSVRVHGPGPAAVKASNGRGGTR